MYHSLTIGGKNTWDEWKLIPTTRPDFAMPNLVTNYVDIPGRYEPLDLTNALTGHIMYSPRAGTWEFYVMNDYPEYNWVKVRDSLARHIHGKVLDIIPEDDPEWFYNGRLTFGWETGSNWSKAIIEYNLNPFKHQIVNPKDYENVAISNETSLTIFGYDEYVVPEFNVSANGNGLRLGVDNKFVFLPDGTSRIETLSFGPGEHLLKFYGNGTVSVTYRGGML